MRRWRLNLILFVATVVTVFAAAWLNGSDTEAKERFGVLAGWTFALPFLLILVFHEFGHWIAARIHGVPASLPYFIPLPPIFIFGTMGAVIAMPDRIRSRNALLDIGAAGPIAGMVVALPTMWVGLSLSEVQPNLESNYLQEGQSVLYYLMKWLAFGPMPEGHDVWLHPTAFAAWAGFLITMINLLPWGQLDGGHIAYALLGERQHRLGFWVRRTLPLLFAYNAYVFVGPIVRGESTLDYVTALSNSAFWLVWFFVTGVMASRFGGEKHPPTESEKLSPLRRVVAAGCLLLFLLLFMPTPLAAH